MEIVFDNLSINGMDQVSFDLSSSSFAVINGININNFCDLLLLKKRPLSGSISVMGKVIKRSNKVEGYDKIARKIGIVSDSLFDEFNDYVVEDLFLYYFKEFKIRKIEDKNQHIVDSLKIVGLRKTISKKMFGEMSYTEKKKVLLACVISVNPSVIVLDDFAKGLLFRDRENYKKLFYKLKNKFNKCFIFVNSGIDFIMGYVDKVIVINKNKLVYDGGKDSFYDNKLYKYVDMPPIISFIKYANEKGYNIDYYTDNKELLKELYRKIK